MKKLALILSLIIVTLHTPCTAKVNNEALLNVDVIFSESDTTFYTKSNNSKYTGRVVAYYLNGTLLFECSTINGKANGVGKGYYVYGKLREKVHYNNGVEELSKKYNKNGKLSSEVHYKNGVKDGITKEYFRNGKLRKTATYKNGKLNGILKYYSRKGVLLSESTYKDNYIVGKTKSYNSYPSKNYNANKKKIDTKRMSKIPGGSFMMGSNVSSDEKPIRRVTVGNL